MDGLHWNLGSKNELWEWHMASFWPNMGELEKFKKEIILVMWKFGIKVNGKEIEISHAIWHLKLVKIKLNLGKLIYFFTRKQKRI